MIGIPSGAICCPPSMINMTTRCLWMREHLLTTTQYPPYARFSSSYTSRQIRMKYSIGLILSIVLAGCGTTSNIPSGSSISLDQSSSVLMLRVTPQYRIHLLRGKIEGNSWVRPTLDVPEVNITPGPDGYIFVKLNANRPGERLGVSLVFPEGKTYGPCRGSIGATFDLEPAAITYVGELSYEFDGRELQYRHDMDERGAKNFVERNLGERHPPLKLLPMVPMEVQTNFCDPKGPIYIPIYVPRAR